MSPTLLIVDDEKNTRDGLRNALGEEFEVYVAPDGWLFYRPDVDYALESGRAPASQIDSASKALILSAWRSVRPMSSKPFIRQ